MSGGNNMNIRPMMQNMNRMGGIPINPMLQMGQIPQMQMPNMNMSMNQSLNMSQNQRMGMPNMPNMQNIPNMGMGLPAFNPMMMGIMPPNFNPNPLLNPNFNFRPIQSTVELKKVWVGHIPPTLSDTFVMKLLESCGAVSQWKRTTDQNGKPKGFGICDFQSVESMLKSLRLLNHLKLEEGYELSIKVDSKTEDFLKKWREQKKQEWIDNLIMRGVDINLEEIKKREDLGEPLEWELQLISKDNETRKLIFEILTQKNDIEMYAKQTEKPEEYLKDLKDLTTNNPFSVNFESEREREREKKKAEKFKKLEKMYKEEEKRWERHEEEREKEILKEITNQEDFSRRKRRLIEKDLNYDSDEEKRKIKQNFKKFEERLKMREKEREFDNILRRKENPNIIDEEGDVDNINNVFMNQEVTYLVPVNNSIQNRDNGGKTQITVKVYEDEIQDKNSNLEDNNIPLNLNLNLENKKVVRQIIHDHDDEYDNSDPYHKKKISNLLDYNIINPETEKEIMEMKNEKIKFQEDDEYKNKNNKNDKINKQQDYISGKTYSSHTVLDKSKLLELHKQIFEMIPKNTEELLKFSINWNIVQKYEILENKIKPWLGKKLMEYIGEDEPNLKAMIIKKLATKSSPYELMEKIKAVFEEDTEVKFIIF